MWLGKVSDDNFINALAHITCGDSRPRLSARAQLGSLTTAVDKLGKQNSSSLHFMSEPQHRSRNVPRLRPGNPHHSNASAPGWRRDSNNRIVKVHRAIVAVKLEEQPAAEG
jgi:hypothetical protein